jgi:uncharacterized protein (DUF362 family)
MGPYRLTSRRGLLLAGAAAVGLRAAEPPKSRVAIARDPKMRPTGGAADPKRIADTLDRAMQACFRRDSAVEAWKAVVRPGEVVGLKINCLAGRGSASTNPALVEAVCERLQQAGVRAADIVIWDRLNADLERAGYRINTRAGGIRTYGNDTAGFEEELAISGAAASLLSKTLTRTCDAVISMPVLKDHGIVGFTMALKNMFGAIHNPNKYHVAGGDPYVADVFMLPPIRRKVRLSVCDALAPQYHGGPSFMPQWSWPYNGVMVSRDPVALDATGWRIIEAKRAAEGFKTLKEDGREPVYIARAADAEHAIGTSDPARIETVEV